MTMVNGIRLLSNSEVQAFKDCPRKWWLTWYRGLRPHSRSVVGARSTGERIHIALAALYSPNGSKADALKALNHAQLDDMDELNRQAVASAFSEGLTNEDLDNKENELRKSFDLEHAMLTGYLEWIEESGVDSDIEVTSVEREVEVSLTGSDPYDEDRWQSPVKLIAKLDAQIRSLTTGRRKFIDHKTVSTLIDPTLGINQQMLHYHIIDAMLAENGNRSEGALYNMLRKVKRTRASKPPYYGRVPIDHNQFELDNYRQQLYGILDMIVTAENALVTGVRHQAACPSHPSRDCVWKCDFFKICRMFDDGSRVEAAIEEHYVAGNPLNYYKDSENGEVAHG